VTFGRVREQGKTLADAKIPEQFKGRKGPPEGQTVLFGEPSAKYAVGVPFRKGEIVLPEAFTPENEDTELLGQLERLVGDEIRLRMFEQAKAKTGGLTDVNNTRYLALRSETDARANKVMRQLRDTFKTWLGRHRGGEGWANQLFDIDGEQGRYNNAFEAFGIYQNRSGWGGGHGPETQYGKLGYTPIGGGEIDVRQQIIDRINDELAVDEPGTKEELIKDLQGYGINGLEEMTEDELRDEWYQTVETDQLNEGKVPYLNDVSDLSEWWDGDWDSDIGEIVKEILETEGYNQWRDIFGQDLTDAEIRIEQAFAKLNSAKSLNEKIAAINISLNVEHVFGKMGEHLDLSQEDLTRLSEMGNEISSLETTPSIKEPEGEYKFERPEVEAEYQASHGITKPSLAERIKEKLTQLKHELTRGKFEFLPRTAEFARIRGELLRLGKQKDVAHQKTLDTIDSLVKDMSKKQYSMFERLVLLSDLMEEIQAEHELPGEWTEADVEHEYNRLLAESDDTVTRAFTNRKELWEQVKDAYIEAQEAIGFHVKDRFDRSNYFRHQVLEFANAKGLTGTGQKLKTATGRGFLKSREGSYLSINTNYLQAEYEVMSQMLYDIQRARVIEAVDRIHNIQQQLKTEAKSANTQAIMPYFEEVAEQMTAQLSPTSERGPYTAEEAFRITLNTKTAIGMSKLGKLASSGRLAAEVGGQDYSDVVEDLAYVHNTNRAARADNPDNPEMWNAASIENMGRFFQYATAVLSDPNASNDAKLGVATVFKGIREKNEFIKKELGDDFKIWRDMIPEDHTTWQPREGQVVYFANSIPELRAGTLNITPGTSLAMPMPCL
jgi:hypothetical protein